MNKNMCNYEKGIDSTVGNYLNNKLPPTHKYIKTRMWANAQRDGRPAEYRWCPLKKFSDSIPCTTPQSLADGRCWSAKQ